MKKSFLLLVFIILGIILGFITKVNTERLTDDVCNFLYGDDCERCTNRDRPFHQFCGTYCVDTTSGTEVYSCSASGYCDGDQTTCEERQDCDIFTGSEMCRVCLDKGCKWTNDATGACHKTNGDVTEISGCENVPMTAEECKSTYRNWIECTDDAHCSWKWEDGKTGPECTNSTDDSLTANFYDSTSEMGQNLCELRENCEECHNSGCTWCNNDDLGVGFCVYSNETSNNYECKETIYITEQTCPSDDDTPKSNCSDYTLCSNCTESGCSWCSINGESNNGKCRDNSLPCTSPDQEITDSQNCPADNEEKCEKIKDCTNCNDTANCGWCETDSLLYIGKCLYKNPSPSVDKCQVIEKGEWTTECGTQSICLEHTNCTDCRAEGGCEWCYLNEDKSQCLLEADCTTLKGTVIDECEKDNLNIYDCGSKQNCSECFTEFPWCQWRYSGDWYQHTACIFWSEARVEAKTLDAISCDEFVACQNRTECNDCAVSQENVLNCVWCQSGDEDGECKEHTDAQNDENCSKVCDYNDEDSSSPAAIIRFNFFCLFASFFALLFYLQFSNKF
ncbi:multiple epidermal growth factor-like domains protein [Anaeramoeba flamelloides]|uniref:Multiple epidermal growth factor-like domains protein n=1 Tax=Anaeramoeba flamelloides TaxID=1746091 RepID=A0AAV7ZE52_9EUKA|nr:multiple epidermal growth factor-like domains protein [Anaeramoeba flamelloides]